MITVGNDLLYSNRNFLENLKNPVYIGDTQGDANAANAANVPFIYAEYGFGEVEVFEDKIESFEDLLNIIY